MKHLIIGAFTLMCLAATGCRNDNATPEPIDTTIPSVEQVSQDTITEGSYLGIAIKASYDQVYSVTEALREKGLMEYISPVNNYFSDLSQIKNRLANFDYLVLDETFDTETGVQLSLESGVVKAITLNNRTALTRWPEHSASAVRIGDGPATLYDKLAILIKQKEYAPKFGRIVLLAKYSFALLDPQKAGLPWLVNYKDHEGFNEGVMVHFTEGKVDYLVVSRYKRR